jgi:hypothetical protein
MTETTIRWSLWVACPLNLLAAIVFAFPSSAIGQQLGLPAHVSPLYTSLVALFVALFGVAYGWLARSSTIDRPMLAFGSIGKFGAFLVAASLWLAAVVPAVVALIALGDLVFAVLWFSWLRSSRGQCAA